MVCVICLYEFRGWVGVDHESIKEMAVLEWIDPGSSPLASGSDLLRRSCRHQKYARSGLVWPRFEFLLSNRPWICRYLRISERATDCPRRSLTGFTSRHRDSYLEPLCLPDPMRTIRCDSAPCRVFRDISGGILLPSRRWRLERPALQSACGTSRRR